ncbi:unnamed protein product [Mycena citricolor]|uniref:Cleavage and polyadenylation specificity factor subunit 2 n=1 Tax=Mycena citricolor TaxID=2018698 RepID=A0AAD2HHN3_9AGAR|nr:unnamed protein product [Mycena citricolor]
MSHPFRITPRAPSSTLGVLVNTTIDDSNATYFTWSEKAGVPNPAAIPWAAISPGHACVYCSAQPPMGSAWNSTWHDGTNNSAGTLSFQGSAVYIYGIDLTNPANISFMLDGNPDGFHLYTGTAQFVFNSLFFSAVNLDPGKDHTVGWTLHATPSNGTTALFDYAVVTTRQGVTIPSSGSASPVQTGNVNAPSSHKVSIGPVVGGTVGGVALILVLAFLGYIMARRRSQREQNQATAAQPFRVDSGGPPSDSLGPFSEKSASSPDVSSLSALGPVRNQGLPRATITATDALSSPSLTSMPQVPPVPPVPISTNATPSRGSAAHSSRTTPLAYLLQVDDVKILLDCGSPDWCPEAETEDGTGFHWEEYCRALRECAPTVDLVLISHGDLAHCGLYAYAYSRWNLRAPTYTSLPVQAMGRIATTEDIEGIREQEDVGDEEEEVKQEDEQGEEDAPTPRKRDKLKGKYVASLEEVQEAFDSMNTLRYSQPTRLQGTVISFQVHWPCSQAATGKCQGLTITPFNAGHTIGGTMWKIRSPSSGTILYAVNVNHMRERHLDGAVIMNKSTGGVFEPLARPDLLITDAERTLVTNCKQRDRDAALIDTITSTLTSSSRSSVFIPCDSSTRLLELLILLDQHWKYSRLSFPICLLSRTGNEMLTFVRSMMEWLGGTVSKEDVGEDGTDKNHGRGRRRRGGEDEADEDALGAFALRFKHLEFFLNPQALIQRYSSTDPKLVLAVPMSLSHGSSRSLFADFARIANNVVLLTSRCEEGTLGRALFDQWNDRQRAEAKWDKGRIGSNVMMDSSIDLIVKSKVPLQGVELDIYLQKEKAAKEKEAAHQAQLARNQRMLEADEDDSDSDSDDDADSDDDDDDVRDVDEMVVDSVVGKKRKAEKSLDAAADFGDGEEGLTKQLLSFDIYLKGNVSKSTSFFKTVGGQAQRFRMFPYVEKKRRVDEYGETVDVAMWLRKGRVLEEEAESEEVKNYRKKKQAEDEAKARSLSVDDFS